MTLEKHLTLLELALPAGREWTQPRSGWVLIRAVSGEGYLLKPGIGRQFSPGDLLLMHDRWEATIRASALGDLKLQYFFIQPQLLSGLLTLDEMQRFQDVTRLGLMEPAIFPANEALAQKFAAMGASPSADSPAERCRRLQLWLETMATLKPDCAVAPKETETAPLRERFRQLVGQLSTENLSSRSFADWALQLGCSKRHFQRLFREEFGMSPRSYVKSMRMARARQFLAESDAKIINVAHQSGYNHLGLFNQMFKQQFGMTPGDWRRQARKKTTKTSKITFVRKTLGLLVMLAVMLGGKLTAATNTPTSTPPSSTNSAGATAPATNKPAALKFEVRQYIVEGNTILDHHTIDSLLEPAKGKEVTFEQINQALMAIQKEYHDRGLVTVLVTLPQQKLTNATIYVKVVESPLTQINVVGNRYYSSNYIMSKLPSLHTNVMLNSYLLQRELDTANANRDYQIYSVLGPGPEPETSALTLRVKDQLPLHVRLELDNYNTPGSPNLRANFNAQYDNLWDADHQIGIQYSFTPENLNKYKTDDVVVPFDSPLIANYSGYYRMPLGQQRPVEQDLKANPAQFGYSEATHQFVAPPVFSVATMTFYASRATTDTGVVGGPTSVVTSNATLLITSQAPGENTTANNNLGSRYSLPLHMSDPVKLNVNAGIDYKDFHVASFNTNVIAITATFTNSNGSTSNITTITPIPQPTNRAKVNYLPLNAGIDLEAPDKWGVNTLNLSANFNVIPIGSGNADFAAVSYSSSTEDKYVAAKLNYNRDQKLYGDYRLQLRASGQWSPKPLISNEQFALGGMTSVRGYHEGEIYGDSGWSISLEPQAPLLEIAAIGVDDRPAPCTLRMSTFFDFGQAYLADAPAGTPGHFNLCGAGLATSLNIGRHLGAQLCFAVPMISTQFTQAGSLHVNFSLSAQF
jgi:hemolysin activation/secretion protein/AraC-like DNA-binding protein